MFILPRFFYNDGATENAGGAPDTEVADKVESTNNSETKDTPAPIFTLEELKEFGFDSPEAAKAFLAEQKAKNIPDEEKQRKEQIEKAELIKYAAENDLMKVEDFNTYESLKVKADRDLVYERFAKELKEEDPELSDEDIKEEFETEYKINSANEKRKAKGLERLQKEAGEIRTPYEAKFQTATSQYNETKELKAQYPKFATFVDNLIGSISDKYTVLKVKEGEEEVAIDIELTKEDRDAISKAFKNEKTFYAFFKGGEAGLNDLKTKISQKIDGYIKTSKFDVAVNKVAETYKGIGVKAGSNVGAENPFALVNNQVIQSESVDASTAKAAQASRMRDR